MDIRSGFFSIDLAMKVRYILLKKSFASPNIRITNIMTNNNAKLNKMYVCKIVMSPYCHIDTGSGTVHLLISKEPKDKY